MEKSIDSKDSEDNKNHKWLQETQVERKPFENVMYSKEKSRVSEMT